MAASFGDWNGASISYVIKYQVMERTSNCREELLSSQSACETFQEYVVGYIGIQEAGLDGPLCAPAGLLSSHS